MPGGVIFVTPLGSSVTLPVSSVMPPGSSVTPPGSRFSGFLEMVFWVLRHSFLGPVSHFFRSLTVTRISLFFFYIFGSNGNEKKMKTMPKTVEKSLQAKTNLAYAN